jgi:hypothetical protein
LKHDKKRVVFERSSRTWLTLWGIRVLRGGHLLAPLPSIIKHVGRIRRGNLPPPSPPTAEEDDEVEQESEEHGGGEDEDHEGGEDKEHGGGEDEEDLSEDEGFGSLPFEADPNLLWEPPEEEVYVAPEERLQPRERKPYQHGKTHLPKLRMWSSSDVVLVPVGKRYMLILAFRYRNFIIIKNIITYILILPFHCEVCSCLPN